MSAEPVGRSQARTALHESAANLGANRIAAAVFVLLSLVTGGLCARSALGDVSDVVRRWQGEVAAGRTVWRVRAGDEAGLPATECDALNAVPGVRAAGAELGEQLVSPMSQPSSRYQLVTASPGLVRVLWPGRRVPAGTGTVVGSDVADRLGLVAGAELLVTSRSAPGSPPALLHAARIAPRSRRDPDSDRKVFALAAAQGATPECLVDAEPAASAAVEDLLAGWFPPTAKVVVTPYLDARTFGRSAQADLAARPSRWAWLLGAFTLGVLSLAVWYARRADFALYRLLGMSRTSIAVMLGAETVMQVTVPAQAGFLLGAVLSRHLAIDPLVARAAVLDDARLVLATFLVPAIGILLVRPRSVLRTLKGA